VYQYRVALFCPRRGGGQKPWFRATGAPARATACGFVTMLWKVLVIVCRSDGTAAKTMTARRTTMPRPLPSFPPFLGRPGGVIERGETAWAGGR
jgi:hypothetical protein